MTAAIRSALAAVVGILAGAVWESLATSPVRGRPTLFKSAIFRGRKRKFHIHHWPAYASAMAAVTVWAIHTRRTSHPAIHMIMAALTGALGHNINKFPDWYSFWSDEDDPRDRRVESP